MYDINLSFGNSKLLHWHKFNASVDLAWLTYY